MNFATLCWVVWKIRPGWIHLKNSLYPKSKIFKDVLSYLLPYLTRFYTSLNGSVGSSADLKPKSYGFESRIRQGFLLLHEVKDIGLTNQPCKKTNLYIIISKGEGPPNRNLLPRHNLVFLARFSIEKHIEPKNYKKKNRNHKSQSILDDIHLVPNGPCRPIAIKWKIFIVYPF
jgi:hypothetical protein